MSLHIFPLLSQYIPIKPAQIPWTSHVSRRRLGPPLRSPGRRCSSPPPCDALWPRGCVRCFAQAKIALKLGFHSRFQTIWMGVEGHDESNRMVGLKLGKGRRANTNVPQLDFFGFCRVVFPFRYHQRLLLLFQYLRLYSCSIYPTEPGAMVCIQAAQCKIPIRNGTTQLLTRFTSCGVDLDELVIGGFYKFIKTVNGSSHPLAFQPGNIKEYSPN